MPYRGHKPKPTMSTFEDDDSTFEAIKNYKDPDTCAGSSSSRYATMRKVMASLPGWIKKAEGFVHALKDTQDVLRAVCSDVSEDDG